MQHHHHHGHHHDQQTSATSLNRLALSATVHCLAGCAIGEVLGMVIGTALGWGNTDRGHRRPEDGDQGD